MTKPRVFCVAAVFGELGQGGWLATGPWVAAMPEIAAGQFVNGFMISNKVTLPLNAIAVSEIPVEQIRQWVKELDQIDEKAEKAEAERVVQWPKAVPDADNVPLCPCGKFTADHACADPNNCAIRGTSDGCVIQPPPEGAA